MTTDLTKRDEFDFGIDLSDMMMIVMMVVMVSVLTTVTATSTQVAKLVNVEGNI